MIVVYGTEACTQCKLVVTYLKSKDVDYEYLTVGVDATKEEIELLVSRRVSSVPIIIVDGTEVTFVELRKMQLI